MVYPKVIELCKKKGISIAKLERECGLGNATIRGWENSNPRIDNLIIVANYLGVSLDELTKNDGGG